MKNIYLDNGATTRVADEVKEKMLPFFTDKYGNPASLHQAGTEAKESLDNARKTIAKKLNAKEEEIIFCSGGTESDNMAIFGVAQALISKGNHIITSKVEHPAVLRACDHLEKQGFDITYLDVDKQGFVDIEKLRSSITDKTILVSIMHVNNEIGTINPIDKIGKICKENDIIFHSDCVQSFTKVLIDTKTTNIDLISISSHKIHGPKGVGALYIRKGTPFKPLLFGGHQERKLRAGTENIPGIVGFAHAATLTTEIEIKQMSDLRDHLIAELLKIPNTHLNGPSGHNRNCNNASISFNFIEGESLLLHLDMAGVAVSTASACSSLELKASHVLLAIGLTPDIAHGTIRFVLSRYTTKEDIEFTIKKTKEIVDTLRKISPMKEGVDIKEYMHCSDMHCDDECDISGRARETKR